MTDISSLATDDPLHISWHDSAWLPVLNTSNALDYFCQRGNPFYDRTCNNETLKMQGLDARTHLKNMAGLEYALIHAQEPVLYVIRAQRRHKVASNLSAITTPLSDYYMVAGVVYKSPDLATVVNSRLGSAIYACQAAFGLNVSSQFGPPQGLPVDEERSSMSSKQSDINFVYVTGPSDRGQVERVDAAIRDMLEKYDANDQEKKAPSNDELEKGKDDTTKSQK
ncbi:mediator of RNA polymerase II transcription subunit 6-like isoform X2 [Gordionus sp. m RMFG-2023]|uniref:mediator of RNA polymerase II transcription subunit 6-like isoform X2 n=1 Tax=Gordionus sp. m RMFG-2023 TaxID=3053472 RepID=UPI0031FD1C09